MAEDIITGNTTPVTEQSVTPLDNVDTSYADDVYAKAFYKNQKALAEARSTNASQRSNAILQENLRAALNNSTYYVQGMQNPIVGQQQGKFIGSTPIIGAATVLTPYAAYAMKREKAINDLYSPSNSMPELEYEEKKEVPALDKIDASSAISRDFVSAYDQLINSVENPEQKEALIRKYGEYYGTALDNKQFNDKKYEALKRDIESLNQIYNIAGNKHKKIVEIQKLLSSGDITLAQEDKDRINVLLDSGNFDLSTKEGRDEFLKALEKIDYVEPSIPMTKVADQLGGIVRSFANPENSVYINESVKGVIGEAKGKFGSNISDFVTTIERDGVLLSLFDEKGKIIEDRYNVFFELAKKNLQLEGKGWHSRDEKGEYRYDKDGNPILKEDVEKNLKDYMKQLFQDAYKEQTKVVAISKPNVSNTYVNNVSNKVTDGAYNAQSIAKDLSDFGNSLEAANRSGQAITFSGSYKVGDNQVDLFVNQDGILYGGSDKGSFVISGFPNNPGSSLETIFSQLGVKDFSQVASEHSELDFSALRKNITSTELLPMINKFTNSRSMIKLFEDRNKNGKGDYQAVVDGQVTNIAILRLNSDPSKNKIYKQANTNEFNSDRGGIGDLILPVNQRGEIMIPYPSKIDEANIKNGSASYVVKQADVTGDMKWISMKSENITTEGGYVVIKGITNGTVKIPKTVFENYVNKTLATPDPKSNNGYVPGTVYSSRLSVM